MTLDSILKILGIHPNPSKTHPSSKKVTVRIRFWGSMTDQAIDCDGRQKPTNIGEIDQNHLHDIILQHHTTSISHLETFFSSIPYTFLHHFIHVWHFIIFLRAFSLHVSGIVFDILWHLQQHYRIISRLQQRGPQLFLLTQPIRAGSWSASRSTQQVEGRVKTQKSPGFFLWMWMMFGQISSRPKTRVFTPNGWWKVRENPGIFGEI